MTLIFLALPPALLGLLLAMDPLERWAARPTRSRRVPDDAAR